MLGWRSKFLEKRNLERPTGKNLYTYRMSKNEFLELEKELKSWLQDQLQFYSLGKLVDRRKAFNGIFVIYAAEWWKRRFPGGRWSWDPILTDLELDPEEWSAPQRSKCIERGFRSWDIKLQNTHGLRFLGSVALQGGLPMKFLAENDKSIAHVLKRTVNLINDNSNAVDLSLIVSWITSLRNYLPQTYQKEEIYRLLAQTILTVLDFKRSTDKESPEAIIEEWKQNHERWQSELPILIGEGNTKQLLEKLVWDVASTPTKKSQADVKLIRTLFLNDEKNKVELRAEVTFPEFITDSELRSLFTINENSELDRNMTISVEWEDNEKDIPIRKIAGQEKFRMGKKGIVLHGGSAFKAFRLKLRMKSGNKWYGLLKNSDELQDDLPWIFADQNYNQGTFELISQGSCKFSDSSLVIAIPEKWNYEVSGEIDYISNFERIGRKLIRVSGHININSSQGDDFRIVTAQATGLEDSIVLYGERVWDIFRTPSDVFRGIPKVRKYSENRYQDSVLPKWKWSTEEKDSFNNVYGPVKIILKEGIYTSWRKKIIVLPEGSSEEIVYGSNAESGKWKFKNWNLAELISTNQLVNIEKESSEIFNFKYNGDGAPPRKVRAKAIWPNNPSAGYLELDFPAKGARIFDSNGEILPRRTKKSLNEIYGIRLFGALGDAKVAQLYLELYFSKSSEGKLFNLDIGQQKGYVELRLSDYKSEIESLLAMSKELDAQVAVQLKIDNYSPAEVLVARYSFKLENTSTEVLSIPSEQLEKFRNELNNKVKIQAQRIDVPGVDNLNLSPTESGNVYMPLDKMSSGPWVIYPDQEAELTFRPHFTKVKGKNELESGIGKCFQIDDEKERLKLIAEYIAEMADNFDDQNWSVISQMVSEYWHLPLSFFDIWKCLINDTKAMAHFTYLAIEKTSAPDDFIERFSLELPFMWEFIKLEDWLFTFKSIYEGLPEQLSEELKNEFMGNLILKFSAVDENLSSILKIAHLKLNGFIDNEIKRSDTYLLDKLFKGGNSSYQKLLRKNIDTNRRWPSSDSVYRIIQKVKNPNNSNLFQFEHDYRDVVINTPIALAIDTVTSSGNRQFEGSYFANELKKIKDFDPDWFVEAYRSTSIRCLHNGLLQLNS